MLAGARVHRDPAAAVAARLPLELRVWDARAASVSHGNITQRTAPLRRTPAARAGGPMFLRRPRVDAVAAGAVRPSRPGADGHGGRGGLGGTGERRLAAGEENIGHAGAFLLEAVNQQYRSI